MKKTNAILVSALLCISLAACSSNKTELDHTTDEPDVQDTTVNEETAVIDALMAEENEVFETNKEIWDKVFAHMEEKDASMAEGDYVSILKSNVEEIKADLSEEEYKTLMEDCEKIDAIEAELRKALGVE